MLLLQVSAAVGQTWCPHAQHWRSFLAKLLSPGCSYSFPNWVSFCLFPSKSVLFILTSQMELGGGIQASELWAREPNSFKGMALKEGETFAYLACQAHMISFMHVARAWTMATDATQIPACGMPIDHGNKCHATPINPC